MFTTLHCNKVNNMKTYYAKVYLNRLNQVLTLNVKASSLEEAEKHFKSRYQVLEVSC